MNQRDNSGALFKNRNKTSDKHPDYDGSCMVGGKEWRIAAWIKEGKSGKFMSLAFSEPRPKRDGPTGAAPEQDNSGPTPF